jgi:monoamine oxidase
MRIPTRRQFLRAVGRAAGPTVLYGVMAQLGLAHASPARGDFALDHPLPPSRRGERVLVLGAGVAGMVSAIELLRAGYEVELLEYNQRPGGRCWTLRGGDRYTELGGATQECRFAPGQYLNPGPWRIPYHHTGLLSYCRQFGVPLQPFIQVNHNAYVHSQRAFGGKPQRFREVTADLNGEIDELLAKVVQQHQLDQALSADDRALLLDALREIGALDKDFRWRAGPQASERRGYAREPGGGAQGKPADSQAVGLHDLLDSQLWRQITVGQAYEYQTTLFQPVGGMDGIAHALARQLPGRIRFGRRVAALAQDERGVTVSHQAVGADGRAQGPAIQSQAAWCVCTIPLSVLGQLDLAQGFTERMQEAIGSVPYAAAVKIGLQFKRRFWEEDEAIYGGISYTDLPIQIIGYPNYDFQAQGGVLLGAYVWGPNAFEYTAMAPADRIRHAVEQGAQIHPQYPAEFASGMSVGWHRSPFTLGCFADWDDATRARHYDTVCTMDRRIVLAGEHASYLPAWQEGAVLSAHNAITQLHRRALTA